MKTKAAMNNTFVHDVFAACQQIPCGSVATYADLAQAIGRPKAYRAVGNALTTNRNTQTIPCHRVVRSDGAVGGYAFGLAKKIARLQEEGLVIVDGVIQDFQNSRFFYEVT